MSQDTETSVLLQRPSSRRGFEVAIICAHYWEADAVFDLFDAHWDENHGVDPFLKAPSDPNAYSTGAIGRHNVVVAHMPGAGKVNAATVATNCRMSFPSVKLALVVGVCDAVPFISGGTKEVLLGDVIISTAVVQYDFGDRLPETFMRKISVLTALGRPNVEIRSIFAKLQSRLGEKTLVDHTALHLRSLKDKHPERASYPGAEHDVLFESDLEHSDAGKTCAEINCNGAQVPRARLQEVTPETPPEVHFGMVACGDAVMGSAHDRDTIAAKEDIIAFETESAGVWDVLPCVVIKAAGSYADGHRSDKWQNYAACASAACMKSFLRSWTPSLDPMNAGPGPRNVLSDGDYQRLQQLMVAANTGKSEICLDMHVIDDAQYHSLDTDRGPRCLGNTRSGIRQRIMQWASNKNGSQIFWMNGPAGSGKSTIVRTIADDLAARSKLAGAYFFKRHDQGRNDLTRILSTIMNQMVEDTPALRPLVWESLGAISRDALASKNLKDQLGILFARPLQQLYVVQKQRFEKCIIFDAIDECVDADIYSLLQVLSQLDKPEYRLNVLLTSRSSTELEFEFEQFHKLLGQQYEILRLENEFEHETRLDIEHYMKEMFAGLRSKHRIKEEWPEHEDFETLLSLATTPSPLFIYASMLFKFLDGCSLPDRELQKWLKVSTTSSDQLRSIYEPIMTDALAAFGSFAMEAKEIIQFLILSISPLSINSLVNLLELTKQDIIGVLNKLYAVIRHPDEDLDAPIILHHRSFSDFLLSQVNDTDVTQDFHIDPVSGHGVLASKCLSEMDKKLRTDIAKKFDVPEKVPTVLEYACTNWIQHMIDSDLIETNPDVIDSFVNKHFLHWLELLVVVGDFSNAAVYITQLRNQFKLRASSASQVLRFLEDAVRFIPSLNEYIIDDPQWLYSTSLVFSPDSSIIKEMYWNSRRKYIQEVYARSSSWPSTQRIHVTHDTESKDDNYDLKLLEFSRDGILLVSVDTENTIEIWSVLSGMRVQSIGHSSCIYAISFAPDAKSVAAAIDDGSVCIFDIQSGKIKKMVEDCPNFLSPTCCGNVNTRKLDFPDSGLAWDLVNWQTIKIVPRLEREGADEFEDDAARASWFQVFSTDGKLVASPSPENDIMIWGIQNVSTKTVIVTTINTIEYLLISPDNSLILSGSQREPSFMKLEYNMWDMETGQNIYTFARTHRLSIMLFDPSSEKLFLGLQWSNVWIWSRDSRSIQKVRVPAERCVCMTHSPARAQTAFGCFRSAEYIVIWDYPLDERNPNRKIFPMYRIANPHYVPTGDESSSEEDPEDVRISTQQITVEASPLIQNTRYLYMSVPETSKEASETSRDDDPRYYQKNITQMALSSKGALALLYMEKNLEVIDVVSGNSLFQEEICGENIEFSANGERIAYTIEDHTIVVRDMDNYSIVFSLAQVDYDSRQFWLCADGITFVLSRRNPTVLEFWNVNTREMTSSLKFKNMSTDEVLLSPVDKRFAVRVSAYAQDVEEEAGVGGEETSALQSNKEDDAGPDHAHLEPSSCEELKVQRETELSPQRVGFGPGGEGVDQRVHMEGNEVRHPRAEEAAPPEGSSHDGNLDGDSDGESAPNSFDTEEKDRPKIYLTLCLDNDGPLELLWEREGYCNLQAFSSDGSKLIISGYRDESQQVFQLVCISTRSILQQYQVSSSIANQGWRHMLTNPGVSAAADYLICKEGYFNIKTGELDSKGPPGLSRREIFYIDGHLVQAGKRLMKIPPRTWSGYNRLYSWENYLFFRCDFNWIQLRFR